MLVHQTIQRPFGVNVFGSAALRVRPDLAAVSFAVTRTAERPAAAFAAARDSSEKIRAFLGQAAVAAGDVQSSRMTLRQAMRGYGDKLEYLGYQAQVAFVVLLRDLDRLEAVLCVIVESGADVIEGVVLRTSKLAEQRRQARQAAFAAARRKAEEYAAAAESTLGAVAHIEDVNPDDLKSRRGHGATLDLADDDAASDPRTYDPGTIEVAAAVMVAFEMQPRTRPAGGF
jgi:uncharacterized protein YggE